MCEIPGDLMNAGVHSISVLLVQDGSSVLVRQDEAVVFEIFEPGERTGAWFGKLAGAVRPRLAWEIGAIAEEPAEKMRLANQPEHAAHS